jgi:hypothetical protein
VSTDPDRPAVPGLEPADARTPALDLSKDASPGEGRFVPEDHPRVVEPAAVEDRRPRSRRLGAADDPDRFDPAREPDVPELPRGLDPTYDPDRFRPPGQGQTLTDLLGKEGTQEGDRDNYQWAYGLIGVFLFLALVAFLFNNVLTP